MAELPGSILFACTFNAVRSPMAEAIMKYLHGRRVYVDSAGLRTDVLDPMVVEVLDEIGIDITRHRPKVFDQLQDNYFDLVVSLSPEAHHGAVELTRDSATEIEFWPMPDPTLVEGSREQRLEAFRMLRDLLVQKLTKRFPTSLGALR